jgi:hypothetical protein
VLFQRSKFQLLRLGITNSVLFHPNSLKIFWAEVPIAILTSSGHSIDEGKRLTFAQVYSGSGIGLTWFAVYDDQYCRIQPRQVVILGRCSRWQYKQLFWCQLGRKNVTVNHYVMRYSASFLAKIVLQRNRSIVVKCSK